MSRKSRSKSRSEVEPEPAPAGALVCPACSTAHAPEERLCRVCGMPLVLAGDPRGAETPRTEAHARARKVRPELARGELVRVAGGRNQAEAELIHGLLLEEGIPSLVRRSAAFDVPDFLAAGQRDILVPQSGASVARVLLHQTELAGAGEEAGASGSGRRSYALRLAAAIVVASLLAALAAWLLLGLAR